ncbi:MAG: coproporphyrinogen III oxidase family protein, partial [Deltaproteobacteria bacterium]|nr:coproporphyrinogen III oxidase family protein [Deltaproteobacteria bacterium]
MRGIYLHIPFCKRKCSYCDFYSEETSSHTTNEFPDLLVREMDLFRDRFPEDAKAAVDTVYFGGGTPTVLAPDALCRLLAVIRERFPVAPGAEVTAETNPGAVSTEDLLVLRKGGFTRISIGVQSFSPTILRTLGRIHEVEDARETIRDARSAGFDSLGIDLIFGIPGQTCTDWKEDLERTVAFLPDHVSAYALAPETGTPLHASLSRGELRMP